MEQKTCLVAGGAGFIGSHLCEALVREQYEVICLDNFITGDEKNLKGIGEIKVIKADVTDEKTVLELPKVDYIFHLASPASPVDYGNYPEETALANSLGTINLLKLAKRDKAKFLFTSTSEIYGDPLEHPQKESYWGNVNPVGVRSCYDEAKRYGEMITMVYIRKYGIDARIIRIFNTYGPKMQKDDGRVISNFINQALEGKDLTIYGDGNQTRSFCYVLDMVEGVKAAMFFDNTQGEIINLGNPEERTIKQIAELIKNKINPEKKLIYEPLPSDDPRKRKPDISKAKQRLHWEPKISLDDGLKKTIEYFTILRPA